MPEGRRECGLLPNLSIINKCVMTSLMMPAPAAATMTTMTNTAPIAVTQPGVGKPDVAKIGFITNNRQGKTILKYKFLLTLYRGLPLTWFRERITYLFKFVIWCTLHDLNILLPTFFTTLPWCCSIVPLKNINPIWRKDVKKQYCFHHSNLL